MAHTVEVLTGILVTAGIVAIGYFVVPLLLVDPFHQVLFFTITMTSSNFLAVVFSWHYFSNTRCYPDEANPVTMYAYKLAGATATHFVLLIVRVSGNIVAAVTLLAYPSLLLFELVIGTFSLKIYLLSIAFGTGLYVYEMINNLIVVSRGVDFKCNERSMACATVKDPFFCDF